MTKMCLVSLTSKSFDAGTIFHDAFRELGYCIDIVTYPHFFIADSAQLRGLKNLLTQKSSKNFVFFFADTTELFLKEPDYTITFSAYRNWYDPKTMRVIPHLWTPVKASEPIDRLKWYTKPPLRLGFMGNRHSTSKLARMLLVSPKWIKEWFLRGRYLRHSRLRALTNDFGVSIQFASSFPRMESLEILRQNATKASDLEIDLVEKAFFSGSAQQTKEYADHMQRNTYILCPRGSENYSFRIYEALSFGRIPVIIDTDVVLPPEINWDRLSVRVPYGSLNSMLDAIRRDYETYSESQFLARQREALSTMAELHTMRWTRDLAKELVSVATSGS